MTGCEGQCPAHPAAEAIREHHWFLTASLTATGTSVGGKYELSRTDWCTELLGMDAYGHTHVELEKRRRRKSPVGSNPSPSASKLESKSVEQFLA